MHITSRIPPQYSLDELLTRHISDREERERIGAIYELCYEFGYEGITRRSGDPYLKHIYAASKQFLEDGFRQGIVDLIAHDAVEESIKRDVSARGEGFYGNLRDPRQFSLVLEGKMALLERKGLFHDDEFPRIRAATSPSGSRKMDKVASILAHADCVGDYIPVIVKVYDMLENSSDLEYVNDSNVASYIERADVIEASLKGTALEEVMRVNQYIGFEGRGDWREVIYGHLNTIRSRAERRLDEISRQ